MNKHQIASNFALAAKAIEWAEKEDIFKERTLEAN
jgi:hypothetical protein